VERTFYTPPHILYLSKFLKQLRSHYLEHPNSNTLAE